MSFLNFFSLFSALILALGATADESPNQCSPALWAKLVSPGEALVDRQHDQLIQLVASSGYKSLQEIRAALSADPANRRVLELLDHTQKLQFALNRPSLAREQIVKEGFQNVHRTGLTQGGSSFDGTIEMRAAVEAAYLHMTVAEYKARGPELMAQFGYLRPDPQQTGIRAPFVSFGDDTWIFKPSSVEKSVTMFPGDTLNRWRDADGEDAVLSKSRGNIPLRSWDQLFIPWQDRILAAPYLKVEKGHVKIASDYKETEVFLAAYTPTIPMNGLLPFQGGYIELQYWSPLVLKDVEAFEFRGKPPTGDFLNALRANHIKIYDGRIDEGIQAWIHDGQKLVPNPNWPPKRLWPPEEWGVENSLILGPAPLINYGLSISTGIVFRP